MGVKAVRKAIIPAAGLETHFLPATKAQPKEMLPIVDKPTIQYLVEEAIASGIEEILIITGRSKRAIEDHFDRSIELEMMLEKQGKWELLERVREISNVIIHYIRPKEANGLGSAVLCAKQFVDNEPFAVMIGDDVIDAQTPPLKRLMDIYTHTGSTVLGVRRMDETTVSPCGIIAQNAGEDGLWAVSEFIENPSLTPVSSQLSIVGRYVINPTIFPYLEQLKSGQNGDVQLTGALQNMLHDQPMLACQVGGRHYNVGDTLGFLEATIDFALKRPRLHDDLLKYMRKTIN